MAFKMATGSGKTVVVAMLIAWHTLNKVANPKDAVRAVLVVRPASPSGSPPCFCRNDENYYRVDLVPEDLREELQKAKVLVTSFHALFPARRCPPARRARSSSPGAKRTLPVTRDPEEMVRRVCRDFGNKRTSLSSTTGSPLHRSRVPQISSPRGPRRGQGA